MISSENADSKPQLQLEGALQNGNAGRNNPEKENGYFQFAIFGILGVLQEHWPRAMGPASVLPPELAAAQADSEPRLR